jgi:ectoine hydroxylase-related dioxygenase (phytanoyl-CoA dioxygenase family)
MADDPLPLETLHERVRPEFLRNMHALQGLLSTQTSPELRTAYRRLVQYLAHEVLGYDVVFEEHPSFRFHFPLPLGDEFRVSGGMVLAHHSDVLYGDSPQQINCWVPVTHCRGTNAPQCAPWELSQSVLLRFAAALGFDQKVFGESRLRFFEYLRADVALQDELFTRCRPLEIDYGEVAMFDARLVHATAENTEHATRMSFDFRLLSIPTWEKQVERFARGLLTPWYPGWVPWKGSHYSAQTAFEL